MNKRGFTLIELLATIVILSLVIVIATTRGFGIFDKTKKSISDQNMKAIKEAAKVYYADVEACDYDNEDYIQLRDVVNNNTISDCSALKNYVESNKVYLTDLVDSDYIQDNLTDNPLKEKIYFKYDSSENNLVCENCTILVEEPVEGPKKTTTKTWTELAYNTEKNKDYRETINKIHFVYYVDITGADDNWGSSDDVKYWIKDNELYIGSTAQIYANKDSGWLFANIPNLESIDFDNFDTSNVTNMTHMFDRIRVDKLDLSSFNTSKVTNMDNMFSLGSFSKIDLSSFDTSNVTSMISMFRNIEATSLDLSTFDTSKVTDMSYMFDGSKNLKTIYVSDNFYTNKVKKSDNMFYNCTSLVGGNYTTYNSSKLNKEYAKIDTPSTPGYFSSK